MQQNVTSGYLALSNSYDHKLDTESHEMPMHLNSNHPEHDYEPIQSPESYGSAAHVYYNCVRGSIGYDDTAMPEYSNLRSTNSSVNDEEEVYLDPGCSLTDIYGCLERKKTCIIKNSDIRYISNYVCS